MLEYGDPIEAITQDIEVNSARAREIMKDYSEQINVMGRYENNQSQNLAVFKNWAAQQTGRQPSKQALHKKYLDDFKVAQQIYMHQVLQRDEDKLEELEGTVEG